MIFQNKGHRDPSYQVTSFQNVFYRGIDVAYAWGSGECGNGYAVLHEDEWLIFDDLEEAVKFKAEEIRRCRSK